MADEFTGFARDAFSFWKGLEKNNNRDWFQTHKDRYEQLVRRPMQLLIEELTPLYGPGRLTRINKDMRFAKEKPYKNYLATGLGGSYISFSKEGLWVGITSLRRKGFAVDTHARLDKPPRGYEPTHPRVELLSMKDMYVGKLFGPADVSSGTVLDGVVKAIADLEPFRIWLREHVR